MNIFRASGFSLCLVLMSACSGSTTTFRSNTKVVADDKSGSAGESIPTASSSTQTGQLNT
jgi:hypothetical protein